MYEAFRKFDLAGKTAVVTGGGAGIGYNLTRALAQAGAQVLICGRRESILKQAVAQLKADPLIKEVLYHTVDLSSRASIGEFSNYATATLGGVDIFVGNAAEVLPESVDSITDDAFDRIMQVNLYANMALVRAFLPHMRTKKWGRVILVSSIASLGATSQDGTAKYAASKAAMNAYVRTAATETGRDGITVNSMVLGLYATEMMREAYAHVEAGSPAAAREFLEGYTSMTALGRLGESEELEGVLQLLASDAGSYITGSNLVIDGGMSISLRPHK